MQSVPGPPQFPSSSSAPAPGLIDKNPNYNFTTTKPDIHNSLKIVPPIDQQDEEALDLRKSNETVPFLSSSSSTSSTGSGSDRTTPISFTRASTNINCSADQMETDRDRPSTSKNTSSRYPSITQNQNREMQQQQFDQQGQHMDEAPPAGNVCRSCRLPATGALDTEGLGTFCSEVCFSNFRLLNYRKKKICMWCQKVYPYLKTSESAQRAADNGDRKEIINGLLSISRREDVKFCSEACETQFRIRWFKNETETHLELLKDTSLNGVANFPQVTGTGSNQKPARKNDDLMITPELWTNEPFEERCIPASKNNGNSPLKRNHLQKQLEIMVNSNGNEQKMDVEQSASMKLSAFGQYHKQENNHLGRSEVNNNSILIHHDLSHRSNTPTPAGTGALTTTTTPKRFKAEKYQRRLQLQHQNYLEQLQKHKQKKIICTRNNHLIEAEDKVVNLKIRPSATATPNRANHSHPNPNLNLEPTNNKIVQDHHKMISTHRNNGEPEKFYNLSRSSIEMDRNAQAHAEFARQFAFQPHPMIRNRLASSSTSSPVPIPIPLHLPQRTNTLGPMQFPIAFLLPVAIPIPFPGWNYNNNFGPNAADQGDRGNIIEDFKTD